MVGRVAALLAALGGLALYDTFHDRLWNASTWWDVVFISAVLMPVTFAVVWVLLPVRKLRGLLPVGLTLALLTYAFHVAGWGTPENLTKLVAVTLIGFWFLTYFETAAWVVLVALIIPWVDAYSVWRGPTKVIVTHHEHVFTTLSYAFPLPGEHTAANLGVPDLLFFALFLAASVQFALRPRWTWLALVASFGATISFAVGFGLAGLPALPGVALGFLLPNADRLWAARRAATAAQGQP